MKSLQAETKFSYSMPVEKWGFVEMELNFPKPNRKTSVYSHVLFRNQIFWKKLSFNQNTKMAQIKCSSAHSYFQKIYDHSFSGRSIEKYKNGKGFASNFDDVDIPFSLVSSNSTASV